MALGFFSSFLGNTQATPTASGLFLFNTLSGKKELFKPMAHGKVGMYNCGPTVYSSPHIGNMRSYIFSDTLRKALEWNHYKVKQIINITDVGHLTDDEDQGQDKIEKKAAEEQKTAKEIADMYTAEFFEDLRRLNIPVAHIIFPRATDHIQEQIAFVKTLEEKGYTYKTSDGIYFNTSHFPNYGKLGGIDVKNLKEGARVEANPEKKNPTDFALWKFSPKDGAKRQQEWESPWGVGFPGWHIECSAMSMKYLGKTFDIHTGGLDHIAVHHNNEIAQSESATGKPFVNYWLHNAFITIEGRKISKSLGNTITIQNLAGRGISPLAYRYWLLSAHYRTPVNFTWESATGAQTAVEKLRTFIVEELTSGSGKEAPNYIAKFSRFINDDLDTPKAIALLWELIKDVKISKGDKRATLLAFDKVLGLRLADLDQTAKDMRTVKIPREKWPERLRKEIEEREHARIAKDFMKADIIRKSIEQKGYMLKDTPDGPEISQFRKIDNNLIQ